MIIYFTTNKRFIWGGKMAEHTLQNTDYEIELDGKKIPNRRKHIRRSLYPSRLKDVVPIPAPDSIDRRVSDLRSGEDRRKQGFVKVCLRMDGADDPVYRNWHDVLYQDRWSV